MQLERLSRDGNGVNWSCWHPVNIARWQNSPVVTDNARNMIDAIGRTDYGHIPCIAHCLQFSILAGLKAVNSSPHLEKCRHLDGHLKHSSANLSELKRSPSSVHQMSFFTNYSRIQQIVGTEPIQFWPGCWKSKMPSKKITLTIQTSTVGLNWQSWLGTKWLNLRQC